LSALLLPIPTTNAAIGVHSSSLNPMRRTEIGEVSIDNSGYRAVGVVQALANSLEKD
jgi:hypothetical protein